MSDATAEDATKSTECKVPAFQEVFMKKQLKLVSLVAAKLAAVLLRGCSGHRALRGTRQAALSNV